ncbi:unnamed protein product [Paramecium pentaurelia]|uniref:WD40-repeat-containing domain n=1 Tax=Paramecium pentaurelia TaxID=43138 RepID=A0A8S1VL75_9CILI|nr:unnamed protein product [Paramecium pentaurelia]
MRQINGMKSKKKKQRQKKNHIYIRELNDLLIGRCNFEIVFNYFGYKRELNQDYFRDQEILIEMEQIQFLQWQGEYGPKQKKQGKWIATWKGEIIQEVGEQYNMRMDQRKVNGNNQVRVIGDKLKYMKVENTFLIKNQGDGITSMITKLLEVGHMIKQVDKSIYIWGVKTWQIILKMDGHSDIVQSVCYFPNGTLLSFASANQSILLWDINMQLFLFLLYLNPQTLKQEKPSFFKKHFHQALICYNLFNKEGVAF